MTVEAERFVERGGGDSVALVRLGGKGRASGIAGLATGATSAGSASP
jgi:hypothetical protein